jgi:hypothetical protein
MLAPLVNCKECSKKLLCPNLRHTHVIHLDRLRETTIFLVIIANFQMRFEPDTSLTQEHYHLTNLCRVCKKTLYIMTQRSQNTCAQQVHRSRIYWYMLTMCVNAKQDYLTRKWVMDICLWKLALHSQEQNISHGISYRRPEKSSAEKLKFSMPQTPNS